MHIYNTNIKRHPLASNQSASGSRRQAPSGIVAKATPIAREGNVQGQFWVDTTCIDCDTCRFMSPAVFSSRGNGSVVHCQPKSREARIESIRAMISCPTASIHADKLSPEELKEAREGLPAPVPGVPGVFHCGWHSERSFGASPWLIKRPGKGNVMVDSPRFSEPLARQIEALGGIAYIFLTHKDDVADHSKWQKRFPEAKRIVHSLEAVSGNLQACEIQLQGEGPWDLEGHTIDSSASDEEDIEIVFTPGHTNGHACLFHKPSSSLFSGDHLSQDANDPEHLMIFHDFNWFSIDQQVQSVRKLRDLPWIHLFPGHGRQMHFKDLDHKRAIMDLFLKSEGHSA